MSAWKPITMAPKDGTSVILCTPDGSVGGGFYHDTGIFGIGGWYWDEDARRREDEIHPHRWQSFPPPYCQTCNDTGRYCIGTSGLESDGNAPELIDCPDCEPPTTDYDPTPWCSGCGAKRERDCKCGPIAAND